MTADEFEKSEDFARRLDLDDPLAGFRKRFYVPEGVIYVDGNSLGLLSKGSESSVLWVLKEWKTLGIRGWLEVCEQSCILWLEEAGFDRSCRDCRIIQA
jgi:kynureninase